MRELLISLPAAVAYLAGPDLVIEFANDACSRLIGDRELIGRPLREALPELSDQGEIEILGRILETGEPVRGSQAKVWVSRDDHAEQLFVDYVYQPVRDAGGAVSGVLLYAADVTAHVRDRHDLEAMAEQVAASEERFRALFETMPQGVVHYAAHGSVLGANPVAREILGLEASDLADGRSAIIRDAVHEDGTPYRPEELPVSVALRTGRVVSDLVLGVRHSRTGELRWLRATAVPDARDSEGRPQRVHVMFADITDQRRLEAELRDRTSLLSRLQEANVLGVVLVGERRVYEANDAFLDIIGYSQDDLQAGRIAYQSITAPEWAGRDAEALESLHRTGAFHPYDKEYVHRDGHRVPVVVGAAVVSRDPFRWVTFVVDLTARQRAEQERAELRSREQAALAEADSARERLRFLLRAGALAATPDRREMLEHAAHLVVPTLADHCVVFLPAADGYLYATSLAHRDPARAAVLTEFRRHKIPTSGPMSIQAAYSTGTTQLIHGADAQLPHWQELAPGLIGVLARLRADSVLSIPLLVNQRPVGVLALARDADRPGFTTTDIEVVEEFARSLAAGIALADAFVREHAIAEALQRSVLPDDVPSIPGLDLAMRYLPATEGADVGGDWYDAFPLEGSRVGLVTGDVAGHNLASAAVMGQARSVLRAYAMHSPHPARVLQRTNTALARLLPDALVSVFYAILHLNTGLLTYANAGHPPPIVIAGPGQTEYLDDAHGVMLGACADPGFTTGHRRLPPGTGLLCYTDGLIENRGRDITEGLATLAETLQRSAGLSAEQICAAVEASLLGSAGRADDVCLLAARLTG
jgi:PAS domain S-box-containing protein